LFDPLLQHDHLGDHMKCKADKPLLFAVGWFFALMDCPVVLTFPSGDEK
jgi:hypothetical protein